MFQVIERETHKESIMSNRHLVGRRQFLVLSSTCAVAAATVGPKLFAGGLALPKRLAVGFAALTQADAVFAASVIPATDGGFIGRGARVTVSGASGAPVQPRDRRAVQILAHYSYLDGAERRNAPFQAWACSRATGCQGSPVGFTVPVDEVQRISLTLGVETGEPKKTAGRQLQTQAVDATESTMLPLTLSLQDEEGAFKLARGFYVVVPLFEGDSDPRWSAWSLRAIEGRWTLVDADGNAASFEHFVLRVDYATL
jgi:hypothetical protein